MTRSASQISLSARSGFTLLELLVVLAIVALAAALVVPNVPGVLGASRMTAATDTTLAFFREARAHAIVRGTPVDLEIDPAGRVYRFAERVETIDRRVQIVLTASLPPGRAQGSPGVVRFYPDGEASGGVVRLASDGAQRTLAIEALTGRIRVVR